LLARLINKRPGQIPWALSSPKSVVLVALEPTTSASAGQLRNLLSWIAKCVVWPFRTIG